MAEPMNKRDAQKAMTREKIIAAAQQAFHHHGYDDVTIRGLAKTIKMSTGVIFSQFADKADLFQQAMGHPAPDAEAFLTKVAIALVGHEDPKCQALAEEAVRLRHMLQGHHA